MLTIFFKITSSYSYFEFELFGLVNFDLNYVVNLN